MNTTTLQDTAAQSRQPPYISIETLPDISKPEMDFYDTSFFENDHSRQLPTPELVLKRPQDFSGKGSAVVILKHSGLAVKFGPPDWLRFEEVQVMWAIRQAFPNGEVPVPEVFGWRTYQQQNFIYMSLVPGRTLRQAWPCLTDPDKVSISTALGCMISSLQLLCHDLPNNVICSINGGPIQDRFFRLDFEKGPFLSIRAYNDWVLATTTRQTVEPIRVDLPYRDFLPDGGKVCFTHGDLTLGNIIVSGASGSWKIESIIDWENAGWYPEYWEYCKLRYGVEDEHEWHSAGWIDRVMGTFDVEWEAISQYISWRCPL